MLPVRAILASSLLLLLQMPCLPAHASPPGNAEAVTSDGTLYVYNGGDTFGSSGGYDSFALSGSAKRGTGRIGHDVIDGVWVDSFETNSISKIGDSADTFCMGVPDPAGENINAQVDKLLCEKQPLAAARLLRRLAAKDPNLRHVYTMRACILEGRIAEGAAVSCSQYLFDREAEHLVLWVKDNRGIKEALRACAIKSISLDFRNRLLEIGFAENTQRLSDEDLRLFDCKRFATNHLSVFIQPRDPKFDEIFVRQVTGALEQWRAAANNGFDYHLTKDRASAQIVASWAPFVDAPRDGSLNKPGWCGILGYCRTISAPGSTTISQAIIGVPVFLRIGTHLRDQQCMDSCLHLLGHALGASKHSGWDRDVLSAYRNGDSRPHTRLTEHDRLYVRALYSPHNYIGGVTEFAMGWMPVHLADAGQTGGTVISGMNVAPLHPNEFAWQRYLSWRHFQPDVIVGADDFDLHPAFPDPEIDYYQGNEFDRNAWTESTPILVSSHMQDAPMGLRGWTNGTISAPKLEGVTNLMIGKRGRASSAGGKRPTNSKLSGKSHD